MQNEREESAQEIEHRRIESARKRATRADSPSANLLCVELDLLTGQFS
jgi:hypothetical protein